MPVHGPTRSTGATVLGRALEMKGEGMPPEGARFILSLGIREEDKRRTLDLLEKNREGAITDEEKDELDSYIQADNVLSIFKATALRALKMAGQTP
jgi:hypothetical protein